MPLRLRSLCCEWRHILALVHSPLLLLSSTESLFLSSTLSILTRRVLVVLTKDKGQWDQPAQETTIYGFLVNTVGPYGRGLVTIPQAKVKDLQLVLAAMQEAEGTSVPDRFLAKVGGKLISVREAFSPAKLWSAEFFWALDMPNKLWWGAKVLVSSEMAESARFLQTALNLFNGMPIWMPHASILFRWDASGVVGWGAAVWTRSQLLAREAIGRAT